MSPKELLYLEDALGHEEYLKKQCQKVLGELQDQRLCELVQQILQEHERLFQELYQTL